MVKKVAGCLLPDGSSSPSLLLWVPAGTAVAGSRQALGVPEVAPANTQPRAEARLDTQRGNTTTHHDSEDEGDDVDGIGGTEAGEDAEEQVVLRPRLRRPVGQLILDVGLGAVVQSPLDVGTGGERGHGAAVRRAGGWQSQRRAPGRRDPGRRRAKGAARRRTGSAAGRGGEPPAAPLLPSLSSREESGRKKSEQKCFERRVPAAAGRRRAEVPRAAPVPPPRSLPRPLAPRGPQPLGRRLFPSAPKLFNCLQVNDFNSLSYAGKSFAVLLDSISGVSELHRQVA